MWQIASATGWSVDYILDGVNYQTLILMLSDAPRYVRQKGGSGKCDSHPERSAEDEANDIVRLLEAELERLRLAGETAAPNLDQSANIAQIHALEKQLEELHAQLKMLQNESEHSPFGFVYQIASETACSLAFNLYGVNYQPLILMLSDSPRYVRQKGGSGKCDSHPERSAEDEANDIVGFFQSKLE